VIWLLLCAVILAGLGVWLLYRARAAQEVTGLPMGRVAYVDTGAWKRCDSPLFSSAYRLTGRPDYLVETRSGLVPVEVKSGTAPAQPYESHVLQLAAYCLLVEETEGRTPPHGILKYEDQAFEIDYTDVLRSRLLDVLDELRDGLDSAGLPRDHDEPARCRACGYRKRCTQKLE
jgi:CRISPR-associated exonuclease Cas4